MSCNEWERGAIKIPTAAWPGLKKGLRDAYNASVEVDLKDAQALYEAVKKAIKGKRGVDIKKAVSDEAHLEVRAPRYGYGGFDTTQRKYKFKSKETYQVIELLAAKDATTKKYKLAAPKKKDFVLANGKTAYFSAGAEGSINLDEKTKTLFWDVSENNHAVDHARESYMGAVLFKLLQQITWTRGSGGTIYGNNEHNEDAGREGSGAGGSFDKDYFGQKLAAATKNRFR